MYLQNGAPAGMYQAVVQFIVNKNGDIQAQTSFGFGMEEEVIRVIKQPAR